VHEDISDQLVSTALRTARVMAAIATSRESAAAGYRRMASTATPSERRRLAYLQHAVQLETAAARARRYSEYELQQVAGWLRGDGQTGA
jgi:hypothetical protein